MTSFYFILSLAGWIWLAVLGGYLMVARRRSAGRVLTDRDPKDGTSADA